METGSILEIHGGRAHLNGVTFFSANHAATATIKNGEIRLQLSERREKKLIGLWDKIPFLRGVLLPIEVMFSYNEWFKAAWLGLVLGQIIFYCTVGFSELNVKMSQSAVLYMFISCWLVFVLFLKLTNLGRYHAAEHMVAHTYDQGLSISIEEVSKQSRVHQACGTNLATFILFIFIICFFAGIPFIFCSLVALSIGYELYKLKNKSVLKFLFPIYLIGYASQYLLYTSKPREQEIQVAIASFNHLKSSTN